MLRAPGNSRRATSTFVSTSYPRITLCLSGLTGCIDPANDADGCIPTRDGRAVADRMTSEPDDLQRREDTAPWADHDGPHPVLPWGKLQEGHSHHLAHHCADVAACFEVIAAAPVMRARMNSAADQLLSTTAVTRLAVLAFLHDVGKLHPGFQAKMLTPDRRRQLGLMPHGHVAEGAALFAGATRLELANRLRLQDLIDWNVDPDLLNASFAHHGSPFEMSRIHTLHWQQPNLSDYDPTRAAEQIGALLPSWFPDAFRDGADPLPRTPAFAHLFCGLVTLADWLGSTHRIFPFSPELDPSYMTRARRQARAAAVAIGLDTAGLRDALSGPPDFGQVTGGTFAPRPVQSLAADIDVDSRLVILEAETGSGKTEAALWRFARLFEASAVDGLYFALPTRAAALQIHGRVHRSVQRLFGAAAPDTVLAIPGYLRAGDNEGQALPGWEVRWDDDDGENEAKLRGRWAAEHAKRFLAATVAVGTVDQAMLAALRVKHAHMRSAALARLLLVVDEVHASDPYMTAVIRHLLNLHLRNGGHAMLMSATLGAAARCRWLTPDRRVELPDLASATRAPYPAVWNSRGRCLPATDPQGRRKSVRVRIVRDWSAVEAAGRALTAARAGARTLVIRNTVAAAIETFEAVREAGGEACLWHVADGPALHHGRFALEDRKLLDAEIERALSPDASPRDGVIVIGTQTLEQSLDIDADHLVTDLCPMDVLLQRIGRLHRHARLRPNGFTEPVCELLTPSQGLDRLTAPAFENGLGRFRSGGGIYRNLHACALTLQLAEAHEVWTIPAMNRMLVEHATHPDAIETLNRTRGPHWERYWQDSHGAELAEGGQAQLVRLPFDIAFSDLNPFADQEDAVRTRLGAEGMTVVFEKPVTGPFGGRISGLVLPAHWTPSDLAGKAGDPVVTDVADGVVRCAVGPLQLRYDRHGLVRT